MPPILSAPHNLLPLKNPHGVLTAVSMMKDEGPYLLEWVAHHLACGFTRLVVYTNDCSDGTDDMLIRLDQLGLAHHRRNDIPKGQKPQPSALNYAQNEPLVQQSDWVIVLDADEFLCIKYGDHTLDPLLDAVKDQGANGLVITWRIFGSAGHQDWSRDAVTDQFVMAAPPMWNKGWGVKTLFQFDSDACRLGINRPKMKNRVLDTDFPHQIKWLNGSGREMEAYFKFRGWRSIVRTVGYDWAQMNHYAVKSIDSYALRKFRGNVNNKANKYDDTYWALQDRNEVHDDSILASAAKRREIFDGLLADPVLNRLHFAALEGAEARLTQIKASPDYADFVRSLMAASTVPITKVEAKPPKPRDKAAIAAQMKDVEKRAALIRSEEKQKPPEMQALLPADLYVQRIPDMSQTPPLDWHPNHAVRLPADPRLFTPPALLAIADGKFQRNLARNVPKLLPQGAALVEIGPASGFLATHLALTRPDVTLTLAEPDANARVFIERLWRENDLRAAPHMMGDANPHGIAEVFARAPVTLLGLGAPDVTPKDLHNLLQALPHSPLFLALWGGLWAGAFAQLNTYEKVIAKAGYVARLPLDPTVTAIYSRQPLAKPKPRASDDR